MSSTDPPVEVVLADGIYMLAVGAVEELLLGHVFASVALFHTILLPKSVQTVRLAVIHLRMED